MVEAPPEAPQPPFKAPTKRLGNVSIPQMHNHPPAPCGYRQRRFDFKVEVLMTIKVNYGAGQGLSSSTLLGFLFSIPLFNNALKSE